MLQRTFSSKKWLHLSITIVNRKIKLHGDNPFTSAQTPSEKIIIRDLPLDLPGGHVIKYLEETFPPRIMRSDTIMTRLPSRENNLTQYFTSDILTYRRERGSTLSSLREILLVVYHVKSSILIKQFSANAAILMITEL